MSSKKLSILSGSKNCYLFNRDTFFQGFPPQSVVTQHFVKFRDESGYETFPVRDNDAGEYVFFDWDDPEAKKVWEPWTKQGILIEDPKLFQDDDDDDMSDTEDEETLRYRRESQERRELFEYYNNQSDLTYSDFSKDNFSDPLESFRSLVNNAFVPDDFASSIDQVIHAYISNDIEHPTDRTYSEVATDVAAINLQMLADTPLDQVKLINQESFPIAKTINEELPPDKSLEQRLSFMNYLSNIQDEARDQMYGVTSINTALLLIGQNQIIDLDHPTFDKFAHRFHGSVTPILHKFQGYINSKLKRDCFESANILKEQAEKYGKYFTYKSYRTYAQDQESPTSPVYRPSSPEPHSIALPPDRPLSEEDFKKIILCITNYLFFSFGENFEPKKDFVSNFFRTTISLKDFFRRFRLRYKYVYFSTDYKAVLLSDIDNFIKKYVNEASSFSVVEIFKSDGNSKVIDDFEIIDREI
jgi:hypothetical protein